VSGLQPGTSSSNRSSRRAGLALFLTLLGLLALRVPGFQVGLAFDDHVHQAVLDGAIDHPTMGPLSLYDFGRFADLRERADAWGGYPFWVDEELEIRFFRPLASASLALDHALFGDWAPGYHAVNLLLFGLLLLLARRLWVELGLPPVTALLALCIYGLEDGSHSVVVGWIANRNSLLEAVLVVCGLLIASSGGGRGEARTGRRLFLALAVTWLAVLTKESGIAGLLSLAVLLLMAPVAGLRATPLRLRRLFAAIAVGLALLHPVLLFSAGYGSTSQFYALPWRAPQSFLEHLSVHATVGLATSLGPFSSDVAFMQPQLRPVLIAVALACLIAVARPLRRALMESEAVRFLACFGLLSFLPQLVAPPSDRLIFVPMLGFAPWIAVTLERLWRRGTSDRDARAVRVGAIVLGFMVLPLSAFGSLAQQGGFSKLAGLSRDLLERLPEELGTPLPRDIFFLQTPIALMALNPGPTFWAVHGEAPPRFWPLQAGRRSLEWTRTGAGTFELESLDEPFLGGPMEKLFRCTGGVPESGREYLAPGFRVVILDGGRRLKLELDGLEPEAAAFLAWDGERWQGVPTPQIGEAVIIPEGKPPLPMVP